MAEFPAMPLWTDALIGDTYHLTPAEFGAYLRLLIAAWRSKDCSLPNDDAFLAKIIGDKSGWWRLKATVMAFWTLGEDDRYRNGRLLDEREYVKSKQAQCSAAGKASALKRLHRGATTVPTKAQRTVNENPTPTPTPISKKERKKESAPNGAQVEFDKGAIGPPSSVAPMGEAMKSEVDLFLFGKALLGKNAGGLIVKLLKAKNGSVPHAIATISIAARKADAREYVGAVIRNAAKGVPEPDDFDNPEWRYAHRLDGLT